MAKGIAFDPPVTGGVVAGFDGSDASRRAVDMAADEAAVRTSVERVAKQVKDLRPWLPVEAHVQHCKAVMALVAASKDAQLVVVGRRGQGGFVDLLLGSTADQVVRRAHSSVLVVRPA